MARIQRLEEEVVNRIAAGEVVQRPANAVKEMLENSLDAGATAVTVTTKQGGLKLLQIQDNGGGIHTEDLGIVCERFTTSKLRTFEDLQSIRTFGFRGEALASITHVAKVVITSRTRDSPCAFRARYADGKIVPLKPGAKAAPQACAGNVGTQIQATDLFYNMPTRLRAFNNPSEQQRRIVEVVTRYAIHYASSGVSFTCKKQGTPSADVHTPKGCSTRQAIKLTFGPSIERELIEVEGGNMAAAATGASGPAVPTSGGLRFAAKGLFTNPNFSSKKSVFILFINHRLVDSAALKRTFESAYADILPRHGHPFIYLSLEVPPEHLDVNVHPTKKEVLFQHQDDLLAALYDLCRSHLETANQSRTFLMQSVLPTASAPKRRKRNREDVGVDNMNADLQGDATVGAITGALGADAASQKENQTSGDLGRRRQTPLSTTRGPGMMASAAKPKYKDPKKMVRTDAAAQTLDAFLQRGGGPPLPGSKPFDFVGACDHRDCDCGSIGEAMVSGSDPAAIAVELAKSTTKGRAPPSFRETQCNYDSVRELLDAIEMREDPKMLETLKQHVFVGVADERYSFVQFETKLILVHHGDLAREMFKQLSIRRFGIMGFLDLSEPISILEALEGALSDPEAGLGPADGDAAGLAREAADLLGAKAEMLAEYFRLRVNERLELESLPDLLEGYQPAAHALPGFLFRLAMDVDWTQEQDCFDAIAGVLADFYAALPLPEEDEAQADNGARPEKVVCANIDHVVRNVFFPAFRWALRPSIDLARLGSTMEVASLEKLYYVFERC